MPNKETKEEKITVSGVTFSAKQVRSAIVTIEGRDIKINEKDDSGPMGFDVGRQK